MSVAVNGGSHRKSARPLETDEMAARLIAIGDIHGCSVALRRLLEAIQPSADDLIVTLGDYVHRGNDTRGALEQLLSLQRQCQLVPLLGNHDAMMLRARDSADDFQRWLEFGGKSALMSYGSTGQLDLIPTTHFEFLASCCDYFETDTHFFIHANYRPEQPLHEHDEHTIRRLSLRDSMPTTRHCSGKTAVVGHSPQDDLLVRENLICVDTGCYRNGWLTALDLASGRIWQANQTGQTRERIGIHSDSVK